ncbi:MAG: SMC family ATPase [Clostridia bacterium]|nr:SMC family ATPase [Clostridia bacterium]
MKPVRLEFCGIHSFSEKAVIDFRALLSGGVFGIFGDTGSGKSTILDCMHLALYGRIERGSGAMAECIHYGMDSAYVEFEFEILEKGNRNTYRVRREIKRKNNATKAFLYGASGDGWLAIADGTRDVNARLEEIIGLTFDDFKMCIALPQGDFAALVKAPTSERVKLVARLFNLEKYGERFSKSVNAQYFAVEREEETLLARMGENAEGSEEKIAEKEREIQADEQALKQAETRLKLVENGYEKAKALQDEKRLYEETCRRFETLGAQLEVMQEKRRLLERIPSAKAVDREYRAVENNLRQQAETKRNLRSAELAWEQAKTLLTSAQTELENGEFDERILQISLKIGKLQDAQGDILVAEKAKGDLENCRTQFKALEKQCPKEDFDGQRSVLEAQMDALGADENLAEYVKHHFKDMLLAEEYAEFRADLRGLAEKHPVIQTDVERLLQKYTFANRMGDEEKVLDVGKLQVAFKEIERKRKLVKAEIESLEKRKRAYEENELKKSALSERGKTLRQAYELAIEKIQSVQGLGNLQDLERELQSLQSQKSSAQAKKDGAQEQEKRTVTELEKQRGLLATYEKDEKGLRENVQTALAEYAFESVDTARELLQKAGDENAVKRACDEFFERYAFYKNKLAETDEKKFAEYDESAVRQAIENLENAKTEKNLLTGKLATGKAEWERLQRLREKYLDMAKELREIRKRKDVCDELRQLVKSNRFLEFIACEYLQEICGQASRTLLSLTSGRYFLRYDEKFMVGDNLDGGNLRAVKTLSGGETFLVSLSLALSLSATICQQALRPIEFFFLDEGFGTLDGKLVETVMDVLGKLGKEFTVGLISHVEELKHRIDNKILVTGATETHGSSVRIVRY